MSTQQDVAEEIISAMQGYAQQLPSATTLTGSIASSDQNISFDPTVAPSRGLVEIDDELVYVQTVDTNANVATCAPWGRGFQGTAAASHAAGARITISPLIPRKRVYDAMNQTILGLNTDLYAVVTYEFTPSVPVSTYTLPAGTTGILAASQKTYGASQEWSPLGRYRVDLAADATAFGGRSITFYEPLRPGRVAKLVLTKSLTAINPGDQLTASGLDESQRDLVVMGSCIKLLMSMDFGRLQSRTVESGDRFQQTPVTSASTIAMRLNQLFQARIQDEKFDLMSTYPMRLSRTN